ncbi:MAG: S8 family serine peptidase, partial [Actinobacteria bacterium]|nr:S8 family serine peptidase [Actinomycetota bacterium]
ARVLNLSLGGTASSRTEELLFGRLQRAGIVVVAAMGNDFKLGNPTEYPAAYEGVLSVGSVDETRGRSSFSNTGDHIDVAAPGTNILSTLPRRRSAHRQERMYAVWSGTSMATPHVAAAAVLVAARRPEMTADAIKARIRETAASLPSMRRRKWTSELGAGLLDIAAAVS